MKPHFIFPTSPMNPRIIDEMFQDQAIALKSAGFGTSAYDAERGRMFGPIEDGVTCIYRGWMLTPTEYELFHRVTLQAGLKPLTSPQEYMATHWITNWYEKLRGITPETLRAVDTRVDADPLTADVTASVVEQINATGWASVFIKDYVKSVKTGEKPILETPVTAAGFTEIVERMRKFRGTIEGGVVAREYENYYPNSETRYFVINGKFYGQEVSFDMRAMSLLVRIARDIPSPFFSVDIAQRIDGAFRVIEIGDGQVSDLVGWTYERFAAVWHEATK